MNKQEYETKCKMLFEKAKAKGVELFFSPEKFDHKKLACLWYGGHLASVKVSDELSIVIEIKGDVYATLLDNDFLTEIAEVRDKGNCGRFLKKMAPFIKDDEQLSYLIEYGRLEIRYNNWIEYDGEITLDGEPRFVDLMLLTDNVLDDNILGAIDEVLENVEAITEDIKSAAQGMSNYEKR